MSHTIYLPVVPRLGLTSEERGKAISAELFNLTLPKHLHRPDQTSVYALTLIQNNSDPDQWALVGDHEHMITVHPERDVTALVALFPQLSEEERSQLTYYISTSDSVMFGNLLPSDSTKLTQEQVEALGWFPAEPLP
jgi:hypothetical protein